MSGHACDLNSGIYCTSHPSTTFTTKQKNAVYYVAKQFAQPCSPEELGAALALHFVREYKQTVWKAKVLGECLAVLVEYTCCSCWGDCGCRTAPC